MDRLFLETPLQGVCSAARGHDGLGVSEFPVVPAAQGETTGACPMVPGPRPALVALFVLPFVCLVFSPGRHG